MCPGDFVSCSRVFFWCYSFAMPTFLKLSWGWWAVLIVNLFYILAVIIFFPKQIIILLVLSFLITVLPMLIAQSNNSYKHFYGYGIPLFFLGLIAWAFFDRASCTSWCIYIFFEEIVVVLVLCAATSATFYSLGISRTTFTFWALFSVWLLLVFLLMTGILLSMHWLVPSYFF
jgi:hypothetical protein